MKFNPDSDIPDLTGRVFLVTGGNVGLGRETILQLSKHKAEHIWLAARNQAKAEAAISHIKQQVPDGSPITFVELDLSSFDSIKAAAAKVKQSSSRLDVVINNAGIMAHPPGLTREGYEIQLGTNHLGHALFIKHLLPLLQKTAETPGSDVRIITLSSWTESMARDPYPFESFKSDMASISTWTRYGYSKLANIHYTRALSKQHPNITCVSVHPGSVATNLMNGWAASHPVLGSISSYARPLFATPVSKGAWNQLWAATARQDVRTGGFYFPVAVAGMGSKAVYNEDLEMQLWNWTQMQLRDH